MASKIISQTTLITFVRDGGYDLAPEGVQVETSGLWTGDGGYLRVTGTVTEEVDEHNRYDAEGMSELTLGQFPGSPWLTARRLDAERWEVKIPRGDLYESHYVARLKDGLRVQLAALPEYAPEDDLAYWEERFSQYA